MVPDNAEEASLVEMDPSREQSSGRGHFDDDDMGPEGAHAVKCHPQ